MTNSASQTSPEAPAIGSEKWVDMMLCQAAKARHETGIGFLVVPTKALAQQQACVAEKYSIQALAITEDTRFAKYFSNAKYWKMIRWFLGDEIHLIAAVGTTFHAPYNSLAPLRSFLPSMTIWVVVTGTVTIAEATTIAKRLGFQKDHFINAHYSLDYPNIIFPSIEELLPTVLFCSQIHTGHGIMTFLNSLSPEFLRGRLIIKLYNSLFSEEYRHDYLNDFGHSHSDLRIVIVTDTLTYGMDLVVHQVMVLTSRSQRQVQRDSISELDVPVETTCQRLQ
ncbi:hypothetical protein C8J56DRAFT_879931 [Mycena floridula]|nr:hypothetical protein C8J56DRAFT_879931 [Mycena floridula]